LTLTVDHLERPEDAELKHDFVDPCAGTVLRRKSGGWDTALRRRPPISHRFPPLSEGWL